MQFSGPVSYLPSDLGATSFFSRIENQAIQNAFPTQIDIQLLKASATSANKTPGKVFWHWVGISREKIGLKEIPWLMTQYTYMPMFVRLEDYYSYSCGEGPLTF